MHDRVLIRRVLIAIDFTETSRRVFYAGISLATRLGAETWVLHVAEPNRAFDFGKHRYAETRESIERVEEGVKRHLDELWTEGGLENVDRRMVSLRVRGGKAVEEILATAEAKGIDLIVIGTTSWDVSGNSIGSTAERVARSAGCSVLCVRPAPDDADLSE